jgi:hypothetical protein
MFGHERSLVERYREEPFVLLGVNTDVSREVLQRTQEEQRLNWRSWWDGPGGPLVARWGVVGLPAVYLLDHRGVIRFESLGAPDFEKLEKQIEGLVREAREGGGEK